MSATASSAGRDPLPAPTGRFPVGRTTIDIVDAARKEIYSANPDDPRELVLWIWYPAAAAADRTPAAYLPPAWLPIAEYLGLDVAHCRTHALVDAPMADEHRYPVLVLSPSGFSPLLLAAVAEELASAGYVVVGVNHPYETAVTAFSDGRVVPMNPDALGGVLGPQTGPHEVAFGRRAAVCEYKAADFRSVADHLERLEPTATGLATDRLDLARMGALGHSFGGNAALEWCRADPRCRAAVNLDGAIWTGVADVGIPRPALQLLADHPEFELSGTEAVAAGMAPNAAWFEAERAIAFAGWRALHERARPAHTVRVAGASHMSFMDIPFLPVRDDSPVRAMLATTHIDPHRMWRITSDVLLAFFARYLDSVDAPLLNGDVAGYPEISFAPP